MKFCSACGHGVEVRVPDGDNMPRYVCPSCATIHYQNPRVVVGCVPETNGKILICKRAIEPRRGYWTLPAGFMENGETLAEGAARETWEEATAHVEIGSMVAAISVRHVNQVHVMFRARMIDERHAPGAESLEVELVDEADIPWDEIAFPSIEYTLRQYFSDRRNDREDLHVTNIEHRRPPHD